MYPEFLPNLTLFAGGGGGGRDNCKKMSKMMHCFKREPRNDRKIWILQYCRKDFCLWLWSCHNNGYEMKHLYYTMCCLPFAKFAVWPQFGELSRGVYSWMESKLKSNIIISIFRLQVTMLSKQEKILNSLGKAHRLEKQNFKRKGKLSERTWRQIWQYKNQLVPSNSL